MLNGNGKAVTLEIPGRERLEWEGATILSKLRSYLSCEVGNWWGRIVGRNWFIFRMLRSNPLLLTPFMWCQN